MLTQKDWLRVWTLMFILCAAIPLAFLIGNASVPAWTLLPGAMALILVLTAMRLDAAPGATLAVSVTIAAAAENSPERVTALAFVALLLVLAIARGPSSKGVGVVTILLLLLVSVTAVATFIAPDGDLPGLALWAVLLVLAIVLAARLTRQGVRAFATLFSLLTAAQVAYSIPDALGAPLPILNGYTLNTGGARHVNTLIEGIDRAQGLTAHPIILGMLCATAFALIWSGLTELRLPLRLLAGGLLLGGVLLSGARSAIVAAAVAVVITLLAAATTRRRRVVTLALVGGVGISFTAVGPLRAFASATLDDLLGSGSFTHRAVSWDHVPDLIVNQGFFPLFFGNGYSSTQSLYNAGVIVVNNDLGAIDNQVVTTLIWSGLAGLTVLLSALLVGFVRGRELRPALAAVAVMLLVFDILGWVSAAMLLVVVCVSAGNERRHPVARPRFSSSRRTETTRAVVVSA